MVDRLQAMRDKPRNNHKIDHGEVFLKESYMSFKHVLTDSAEKPKRSFRWSLVSVRQ